MIYEHRQIEEWPGELRNPWERKGSTFKADWDATLKLLGRELDHLDGALILACSACGGEIVVPPGKRQTRCFWCGATTSVQRVEEVTRGH
jgi:hypothetical protein